MSGILADNTGRASGLLKAPAGGATLQFKQTIKTDTQTFSASTTNADITGLSVTLTPTVVTSKILVRFMVSHWGNDSHCQIMKSVGGGGYSIISPPSSYGSRTPTHSGGSHRDIYELNTATMEVLDDHDTTSEIIYKMTFNNGPAGGGSGYINRTDNNSDSGNGERGISQISATEIAVGVL